MRKIKAIIFDLDGTLYSFDQSNESNFASSEFGKRIKNNCIRFLCHSCNVESNKVEEIYNNLYDRYNGEMSLAIERVFGINRGRYFASTWDLPVEQFVAKNQELKDVLYDLDVPLGVLTAAPRIWTEKVLQYLGIRELFGEAIFCGDPDLRKPNPKAFYQVANFWSLEPSEIVSIGDQELSDIAPAQSLGMMTVRIAKKVESQADLVALDVITAIKTLKKECVL